MVLILVTLMVSGAIPSLYLKAFNHKPPLPVMAVNIPIMMLMIPVIILRLRSTVFGLFASLPFVFFAVLAIASSYWSENAMTSLSEATFYLLIGTYFACIGWSYTWERLISVIWSAMVFIALLSLFLFFVVPTFGKMSEIFPGALMGVMMEKNAAGQVGVFGAILTLSRFAILPGKLVSTVLALLIFTGVLLLSTSKTALIAYMLSISIFIWVFSMRRHPALVCAVIWLTVVGGGTLAFIASNNLKVLFAMIGRNATFTGRADIWKAVTVSVQDKPWLGHGYSAYWDKDTYATTLPWVLEELKYFPNHAHNSWVETTLGLGRIGSYTLTAIVIVSVIFAIARLRSSNGAYFVIPFLLAACVIGSFESVLAYPTNFAGAFILLVAAKVVRPPTQAERARGMHKVYAKASSLIPRH